MRVDDLDTPAVVVDLDVLEANIRSLAGYCKSHGIGLRPHTKTHKIPEIARMQVQAGAIGITVAKVGEAEVMARAGLDNILVAYPVIGAPKLDRLVTLAQTRRILVALDSPEVADGISRAAQRAACQIGVLVEFDVGMRRCGIQDLDGVLSMARQVDASPGVRFEGVFFYPGHIWDPPLDQGEALRRVSDKVDEIVSELRRAGLECPIVSGGSTPTACNSHRVQAMTEIRAGTYVFNDMNEAGVRACELTQCALKVLVTVVSTAVSGRVVIDGGSKTFSSDRLLSGDGKYFGHIIEHPEIKFVSMSEEHGHLEISSALKKPSVGDRLTIIPNHVCACVNLHNQIYYQRNGIVEGSWDVEGRGRIR